MRLRLLAAAAMTALVTGLLIAPPAHAAVPTGNLLTNPGFEVGPSTPFDGATVAVPGWFAGTPNARAVRFPVTANGSYDAASVAAAGGGCRSLVGPSAPLEADDGNAGYTTYYVSQFIPVTADAIGHTLRVSALLGRVGKPGNSSLDYGYVTVTYRNADGVVLDQNAGTIDNMDVNPATSVELTRKSKTTDLIPAGTATIAVYAASVVVDPQPGRLLSHGLVDDVSVSFDNVQQPDPPAGCQPPSATTGTASSGPAGTTISGTVNNHNELASASFRLASGDSTAQTVPASASPVVVSTSLTGLKPATTYTYSLVTRPSFDGTLGPEVVGAPQTFTTGAAPTFKQVVKAKLPKGGCVSPGGKVAVSVADPAGVRRLTSLVVTAKGVGKAKMTVGNVGAPKATVKVKKLPARPGGAKPMLTLTVTALFTGGIDFAVAGKKKVPYC